ncbi:MAG: class I SAM-dependent methyltransferase [Candidatus Neomarinimicrobiota bacterium]
MKGKPLTILILAFAILSTREGIMVNAKENGPAPQDPKNHQYSREGSRHSFDDIEKWVERFENPERDEWQKPDAVIRSLDLTGKEIVADIGSATGYFPVRFARALSQGRVYGVDTEEGMVEYLNDRAKRENLSNLVSIQGEPDDPKLPEPVDIMFICDTYHHIRERTDYFSRLKGKLLPGGRLVIVDFVKGEIPVGPPDAMKLRAEEVIAELAEAGYDLVQRSNILPYQYFLIFRPAEAPQL